MKKEQKAILDIEQIANLDPEDYTTLKLKIMMQCQRMAELKIYEALERLIQHPNQNIIAIALKKLTQDDETNEQEEIIAPAVNINDITLEFIKESILKLVALGFRCPYRIQYALDDKNLYLLLLKNIVTK